MARLYLIRHGRATTTWEPSDLDPGLDEVGRAQAEARADQMTAVGPLLLLSSPLRRARETAAPLERRWKTVAQVDPRVGEIPSAGISSEQRMEWLKTVLQQRWRELDPALEQWRNVVLNALLEIRQDTVVFSHFVAINVAVGYALGDHRVTCFHPENCSCTILDVQDKQCRILELGTEAPGRIL